MSSMKDIVGKRFGSLTVLELHHRGAGGKLYWLCECDCGNRRSNRLVTYHGKTQNVKQWANELGLDYKLVEDRIKRLGWSVEDAFNTPSLKHSLTFEYAGEEHPIAEWARILGVMYNALYFRIKRGDLRDFEDYFDKL